MTYERFSKIIEQLEATHERSSILYKHKVDLLDYDDPYQVIITELLTEIYSKEGYDWFSWYCYENEFGKGKLKAWEGETVICYDHKSLWKYLEDNYSPNK